MATQPWLSVVAPSPPPSPPVPPPAMAAPGGRRVVLDALRAALRPLLLRFEYRVRTAVEGSSAAWAIARAERQLVEQRVILESMERRIVALVAELAQLQQELSERRDAPIVQDRDGPGDPA
ncbi:MAG: hypothetical protein U1E53_24205 [Dongiaceae bacterium]